jgi:alanyl-tRNA synthetase
VAQSGKKGVRGDMDAREIRASYLAFMRGRGHTEITRASLIPGGDSSTLFTGSGMQSLLPFLLGQDHPAGNRLVDSQPCLRAQDIEEVGDNRHTTFFEMLGNWSLGDYFKEQQIRWFFEFLVDVVKLDPSRIYVSCFIGDPEHGLPRDDEAAAIWQQVFREKGIEAGIAAIGSQRDGDERGIRAGERIFFYDSDENWWSRGGNLLGTPLGDPCGPDSEVFFDFGPAHHDASYGEAHPASDSGRFMEIGNQVFMQYRRELDGSFTPLERRNVDFGGGLERIAAAALDTPDVYQIGLLAPIVQLLERLSGASYAENPKPLRVIADHLRGAVFLAVDGVHPSNKEQGYVMRRLVRRAIRTAHELQLHDTFLEPVVDHIADLYADAYPDIRTRRDEIVGTLLKEEKTFRNTLSAGLKALRGFQGRTLTGGDLFLLSDTHGFPVELSLEEAAHLGLAVDPDWASDYAAALDAQRERSRRSSKLHASDGH